MTMFKITKSKIKIQIAKTPKPGAFLIQPRTSVEVKPELCLKLSLEMRLERFFKIGIFMQRNSKKLGP